MCFCRSPGGRPRGGAIRLRWDLRFENRGWRFAVCGLGSGVGFGILGSGFGFGFGFWVWVLGFGIWGAGVQGAGCRVQTRDVEVFAGERGNVG